MVKVVDACQSGVAYIKELNSSINKYFQDSKNQFKSCYFFNSCLDFQSSYQSSEISDFTFSFVKSILTHPEETVRYKNIIDYISDDFDKKGNDQTPFFVTQAGFTEAFGTIIQEKKETLKAKYFLKSVEMVKVSDPAKIKFTSLKDIISNDAKDYVSVEEALNLLKFQKKNIENLKLTDELSELYELKFTFLTGLDDVPKINEIASWLKDNKDSYFVKINYEDVDYQTEEPMGGVYGSMWGRTRTVTRNKQIVKSYDSNFTLPFQGLYIVANTKYPNAPSYTCNLSFVMSKKIIRYHYFFTEFVEENWEKRRLKTSFKWQNHEILIKDSEANRLFVEKIFDDFKLFILDKLHNIFKPNNID
ncbi:MAG: hypothetical protein JWO09_3308 [Bacteroidetes bacterium]|nr:hypothetical protein [Bacteroidota bacterium]